MPSAIFYCTDVEGDLGYFLNVVSGSNDVVQLVRYAPGSEPPTQRPGCEDLRLEFTAPHQATGHFVFGGDACDKQAGDIRFVSMLLDFADRHPGRVHWVLGNRDVNKLRFFAELHHDPADRDSLPPPDEISRRCYWDTRVWNPDAPEGTAFPMSYPSFLQQAELQHGWIAVLRWTLTCTMGSAELWDTRRTELARLRNCRPERLSETEIYQSFRSSVVPGVQVPEQGPPDQRLGPWMLDFMRMGLPALLLGPYLFVHGGLNPLNVGHIPGRPERIEELGAWIQALSDWFRDSLELYQQHPGDRSRYELFLDYNLPTLTGPARHSGVPEYHHGGASAVNADWFVNGDSAPIPEPVLDFLAPAAALRWVVCGHKPHGDCPAVMRNSRMGHPLLGVVVCDTSYSDPGTSGRQAWTRLQLYPERITAFGELGTMGGGRRHGFQLRWPVLGEHEHKQSEENEELQQQQHASTAHRVQRLIGRQLPEAEETVPEEWRGAWVKSAITNWDGSVELVVVKARGFRLSQEHWPLDRVEQFLGQS